MEPPFAQTTVQLLRLLDPMTGPLGSMTKLRCTVATMGTLCITRSAAAVLVRSQFPLYYYCTGLSCGLGGEAVASFGPIPDTILGRSHFPLHHRVGSSSSLGGKAVAPFGPITN